MHGFDEFLENRAETMALCAASAHGCERSFDTLRMTFFPSFRSFTSAMPKIYNLRADPFEEADHSMDWAHWRADHLFLLVPAQQVVGQFLSTFKEFPPSQKAGSFSLDQVLETLTKGSAGK